MISNNKKLILFLFFAASATAMVFSPLSNLVRHARPSDYYSHIPVVPAISAYLFFRRRRKYFWGEQSSLSLGILTTAAGLGVFIVSKSLKQNLISSATICTLAAIIFLSGSFLMLFGKETFRRAFFPFAFLLFMIPLPVILIERIVSVLATASAGATHILFKGFGVPFVQDNAYFHLPDFNIEVAKECSGIRSSIALVITTVLAGHIFLDKFWKKMLLVLAVFPVTVFKNGVRIITLYMLSYFVDMRIIEGGFLHQSGGFIFFGIGLIILGLLIWLLRRSNIHKLESHS
jgi:exosortase